MKSAIKAICSCFGYEMRKAKRSGESLSFPEDSFAAQRILLQRAGIERPVIFDLGAHQGQTTARYAEIFPGGTFYCFEPFPNSFEELRKKFAADDRVKLMNLAVGKASGKSDFFVNAASATNSLLPRPKEARRYYPQRAVPKTKIEVMTTSIDDFVRAEEIERIDLLKLDIQGGELLAFQGSINTLQRLRIPILFTETMFVPHYERQPLFHEIWAFLGRYGYSLFDLYHLRKAKNGQLRFADALFVHESLRRNIVDGFEAEP